jgi:hypothetical protein
LIDLYRDLESATLALSSENQELKAQVFGRTGNSTAQVNKPPDTKSCNDRDQKMEGTDACGIAC